jgi:succinate dehydrogenase/fumarate reductase cytochrome b subunit
MFSIIMSRLVRDRPSIRRVDKFTFKEITRSASSPHVIMVFIMFFMTGTMLYGLALFLPSIVSQLEFSPNYTQLLSVGPFVVGFFGAYFFYGAKSRLMHRLLLK